MECYRTGTLCNVLANEEVGINATWSSSHAFTDHHNILPLAKSVVPKLVRWRLQMQQFNYTVIHVAGEDVKHAIADCLSGLHGPPRGIHGERS